MVVACYKKLVLVLLILTTFCHVEIIDANVVFRFALDFHIKNGNESQMEEIKENLNKTITLQNNQISITDNNKNQNSNTIDTVTVGPNIDEIWAEQNNLTAVTNDKLKATTKVISNVNREISPLVGRSDLMATKVKLITRYLNAADTADRGTSGTAQINILRKFVDLVDQLRTANDSVGNEKSLEFKLMDLVLDKYGVIELQKEIRLQLKQMEEAWQNYVNTKLVEVVV